MSVLIGVDVGGTFTDGVVVVRGANGDLKCVGTKVRSTYPDPSEGVVDAVQELLRLTDQDADSVERVIHGTTVALNTVLERKGARLAVITTSGFEDQLEIGRSDRDSLFDYFIDAKTPGFLCPRDRIIGAVERVCASGSVLTSLDGSEIERIVDEVQALSAEAVAVCLLHSHTNPNHERMLAEALGRRLRDIHVSVSSEIDPRAREYERLVLTVFDAYVRPVMHKYISSLRRRLSDIGVRSNLQIMHCRAGIVDARRAEKVPIMTFMSGPAAGVLGACHVGSQAGFEHLISLDVGGTSSDVSLVPDGTPLTALEGYLGQYPLRQPMLDISSIGAGGGSIAWVDAAGDLHVGPQSAGSSPGPACYGRGGADATVTDASVALGYVNVNTLGYGSVSVDADSAHRVLSVVGRRLGLSSTEVALGIHRIVNANMSDQLRLVSVARGFDPRNFTLVALGGAGPLHAGRLADSLGMLAVVIPPAPGVLSALGLLMANIEQQASASIRVAWSEVRPKTLEAALASLDEEVSAKLIDDGVEISSSRTIRTAELRYRGQGYNIEIHLSDGPIDEQALERALEQFHRGHELRYSYSDPTLAVDLEALRVTKVIPSASLGGETMAILRPGSRLSDAQVGEREALFDSDFGFVTTPVFERYLLPLGVSVVGPAIVEQPDTTTVIYPGQSGHVDRVGNLIVRPVL